MPDGDGGGRGGGGGDEEEEVVEALRRDILTTGQTKRTFFHFFFIKICKGNKREREIKISALLFQLNWIRIETMSSTMECSLTVQSS